MDSRELHGGIANAVMFSSLLTKFVAAPDFQAGDYSALARVANLSACLLRNGIEPETEGDWNVLLHIAAASDELGLPHLLRLVAYIAHECRGGGASNYRQALLILTGELGPLAALDYYPADNRLRDFVLARAAIHAYLARDYRATRALVSAYEDMPLVGDDLRLNYYDPEAQRLLLRCCAAKGDSFARSRLCERIVVLAPKMRARYCHWVCRLFPASVSSACCGACTGETFFKDAMLTMDRLAGEAL